MDVDRAAEYAAGLRELADWIEEHHELVSEGDLMRAHFLMCRLDRDQFLELSQAVGGKRLPDLDRGKWFTTGREFGPFLVQVYIAQEAVGSEVKRMRETTEFEIDPDVLAALAAA